jgi:hypothetical protein
MGYSFYCSTVDVPLPVVQRWVLAHFQVSLCCDHRLNAVYRFCFGASNTFAQTPYFKKEKE